MEIKNLAAARGFVFDSGAQELFVESLNDGFDGATIQGSCFD
jgi:hypothetical protein